jgi:hypothetical protein
LDERLREDAKQLLRVTYERQVGEGDVGLHVDLAAGAQQRGLSTHSPHLTALVDYMEVAGWIEADTTTRSAVGDLVYLITERGTEVLREV